MTYRIKFGQSSIYISTIQDVITQEPVEHFINSNSDSLTLYGANNIKTIIEITPECRGAYRLAIWNMNMSTNDYRVTNSHVFIIQTQILHHIIRHITWNDVRPIYEMIGIGCEKL